MNQSTIDQFLKMPEKRKSARLADMEASYTKKKVKYVEEYDESDFEYEEEASASDMDEDASDVEEIDREPEVDPEEIARLLEVAAEKAQAARQQIRALLADLSPEDARDITALLDRADAWDKPGARYSWSTLPSEIKNNIYKYVFVNDEPIKPHIWFPNVPNRRRIRKYDLGANFLRCNKEIYHEGRSILYGENTFHISPQFRVCLGERDKHAPLIQKVVVRRQKLSSTIMKYVALLKKLTEITVVGGPVWEYSVAASGGGMSHEQRLAKSFTHMTYYGQHLFHISACPTMWYVLEDNLTVSHSFIVRYMTDFVIEQHQVGRRAQGQCCGSPLQSLPCWPRYFTISPR